VKRKIKIKSTVNDLDKYTIRRNLKEQHKRTKSPEEIRKRGWSSIGR